MRIVAGQWRGRRIDAAPSSRPSTERVREALFSIWASRVPNSRFLDLFCGGGAVGFEALSRAARCASFVDEDSGALRIVRRNGEKLGAEGFETRRVRLPTKLWWANAGYDLVFADPPYGFDPVEEFLASVEPLLGHKGRLAFERSSESTIPVQVGGLVLLDRRRWGSSSLSFFGREGESLEEE